MGGKGPHVGGGTPPEERTSGVRLESTGGDAPGDPSDPVSAEATIKLQTIPVAPPKAEVQTLDAPGFEREDAAELATHIATPEESADVRAQLDARRKAAAQPQVDLETEVAGRRRVAETSPGLATDEDLRIGPYDVFRALSEVPGGRILEARDASREQRLLQVARLRAPKSESEERERADLVRAIAQQTSQMSTDVDVRVLVHGDFDRPDGSLILYWALPWKEGAERLGRAADLVRTPDDLSRVAVALLER